MPISNPGWADRWQAECERAARHAGNLIRLSGRRACGSAIVELIRTAPRTPEDNIAEASFFGRCGYDAANRVAGDDYDVFSQAMDYFEELAAVRPPAEPCWRLPWPARSWATRREDNTMQDRLRHDFCHALALRIVEVFRPLLRDEEAREAYAEVYEIARQESEKNDHARSRQQARLRPMEETNRG